MPTIVIDGRKLECRDKITVLQAALDAGIDVPHYCYHPGLSIAGSCRLCLMEMKVPDRKTKELVWSPQLVPSCRTPATDGLEVRFDSEKVINHRKRVMEFYLVNHPLDCPVCDQAGECYLQDYSQRFGEATSRAVDAKEVNPKKDIGPRTYLYQDRCVSCTRCVRFTREVAGTGELCVVNRGEKAEIDVFAGVPLDNKLQGNVVDLCPVGSMLDKDFLFAQRVWFLSGVNSICRGCSTGCAIRVDVNGDRVYRLKPRYNPGVNGWWMCDEGRFGWKFVGDKSRLVNPTVRHGAVAQPVVWEQVAAIVRERFEAVVRQHGAGSVAVQLSPEMACEEAWLLASFIREVAPEATLALGDVWTQGQEEKFPVGCENGDAKFVIRPEKHPNRRGVETVIKALGGKSASRDQLWSGVKDGLFKALWIVGGYPRAGWADVEAAGGLELLVVQDMFPSGLTEKAHIVLPACAWVEREGSFMNHAGLIQPFGRALNPPDGATSDGQYLFAIAGHVGIYSGQRVREMMAKKIPAMADVHVPPAKPRYQH